MTANNDHEQTTDSKSANRLRDNIGGVGVISRRTAVGILGLAAFGVGGAAPAAARPRGGRGGNQPFYNWDADVDANGHGLFELGMLGLGDVVVADLTGSNLEVENHRLHATDTRTDVVAKEETVIEHTSFIDFRDGLVVERDGDGANVAVDPESLPTDTRTDIEANGDTVAEDATHIDFREGLDVDASDAGASVSIDAGIIPEDTRADVRNDGAVIAENTEFVDFVEGFTVAGSGNGATVALDSSVIPPDTRTDIRAEGELVREDTDHIDFGEGLAVSESDGGVSVHVEREEVSPPDIDGAAITAPSSSVTDQTNILVNPLQIVSGNLRDSFEIVGFDSFIEIKRAGVYSVTANLSVEVGASDSIRIELRGAAISPQSSTIDGGSNGRSEALTFHSVAEADQGDSLHLTLHGTGTVRRTSILITRLS